MKPQVIACVFNNLATDQRVEKVCKTLFDHGYPILLVGNNWGGMPDMERPYPFHRIKLYSKSLKTGYVEFQWKLYRFLKKNATKRTIILANDLDILYACFRFSVLHHLPLVYDSHEIFTELPYIQGRSSQEIWRWLENKMIRRIRYMMTESNGYADWFVKKYGISKPLVINNFPRRQMLDSKSPMASDKKIIIYQGAVNPFRGIDDAILAMKLLPDYELWIVGDGPARKEYEELAREERVSNVVFHGKVPPSELREITKRADLGVSLEENAGLSYYLSLPNKVADYVQARIPIVGTDFPETAKVIEGFGIGVTLYDRKPEHIAEKIKEVLSKPEGFYKKSLETASHELCWEVQEQKILELYDKVTMDYHFT